MTKGVTPDDELVIKLAFLLAGEIREIQRAAYKAGQADEDKFWQDFLRGEGQSILWRRGIVTKNLLFDKK